MNNITAKTFRVFHFLCQRTCVCVHTCVRVSHMLHIVLPLGKMLTVVWTRSWCWCWRPWWSWAGQIPWTSIPRYQKENVHNADSDGKRHTADILANHILSLTRLWRQKGWRTPARARSIWAPGSRSSGWSDPKANDCGCGRVSEWVSECGGCACACRRMWLLACMWMRQWAFGYRWSKCMPTHTEGFLRRFLVADASHHHLARQLRVVIVRDHTLASSPMHPGHPHPHSRWQCLLLEATVILNCRRYQNHRRSHLLWAGGHAGHWDLLKLKRQIFE